MLDAVDRVILVRHAMPAVVPELPAERWELDAQGRAASRALSAAVTEPVYYVASDEPKALQTVQEMSAGQPVTPEPGFREVGRPHRWSDVYRQQAQAYVDGISTRTGNLSAASSLGSTPLCCATAVSPPSGSKPCSSGPTAWPRLSGSPAF